MDIIFNTENTPQASAGSLCPTCHQPTLPQYYFCPNCGANLHAAPLSTTPLTQAGIYLFSAILPLVGFIFVTRWPGMKYYKSNDPKTKLIGEIAWTILIISTLITIWLAIVWTKAEIQRQVDAINADFGGL